MSGDGKRGAGGVAIALAIVVVALIVGSLYYLYSTGSLSSPGGVQSETTTFSSDSAPVAVISASLVTHSNGTATITATIRDVGSQSIGLDEFYFPAGAAIASYFGTTTLLPNMSFTWSRTIYGNIIQKGRGYSLDIDFFFGPTTVKPTVRHIDAVSVWMTVDAS
ncbi:MAG: hypothetical protein ACLQEQ_07850 [Nitrososphaerales archaeon]